MVAREQEVRRASAARGEQRLTVVVPVGDRRLVDQQRASHHRICAERADLRGLAPEPLLEETQQTGLLETDQDARARRRPCGRGDDLRVHVIVGRDRDQLRRVLDSRGAQRVGERRIARERPVQTCGVGSEPGCVRVDIDQHDVAKAPELECKARTQRAGAADHDVPAQSVADVPAPDAAPRQREQGADRETPREQDRDDELPRHPLAEAPCRPEAEAEEVDRGDEALEYVEAMHRLRSGRALDAQEAPDAKADGRAADDDPRRYPQVPAPPSQAAPPAPDHRLRCAGCGRDGAHGVMLAPAAAASVGASATERHEDAAPLSDVVLAPRMGELGNRDRILHRLEERSVAVVLGQPDRPSTVAAPPRPLVWKLPWA